MDPAFGKGTRGGKLFPPGRAVSPGESVPAGARSLGGMENGKALETKELKNRGGPPWRRVFLEAPWRFLKSLAQGIRATWKPVLAGVLLALVVRAYVLDIYGVRKHSMEPTLHAEERGPSDRVAVFKLAYLLHKPRRWDLCVFQKEGEPQKIVKRVVGLPGEWLRIEDGDVWVGPKPGFLHLLKKTPADLARVLVVLADQEVRPITFPADTTWAFDPALWRPEGKDVLALPPSEGAAKLSFRGLVHGGYLGPDGEVRLSVLAVRDFGAGLVWQALDPGSVLEIRLDAIGRTFSARVSRRPGEVRVEADGWEALVVKYPRLAEGKPVRLRFVQADCRVYLWVDGKPFFKDVGGWPSLPRRLHLGSRWNGLSLSVRGGRGRLSRIQVVRDLYYTDVQGGRHGTGRDPQFIGRNEYYVLGDNSAVSEDSRHYGPIPASDLIGRPLMIVLPLRRIRWL